MLALPGAERPLTMFVNQDKSSPCRSFYCLAANSKETISVGRNARVHLGLWSVETWCGCAETAGAWGSYRGPQPHLVWLAGCVWGGVKKFRKVPC